jgi:hypothetical protein
MQFKGKSIFVYPATTHKQLHQDFVTHDPSLRGSTLEVRLTLVCNGGNKTMGQRKKKKRKKTLSSKKKKNIQNFNCLLFKVGQQAAAAKIFNLDPNNTAPVSSVLALDGKKYLVIVRRVGGEFM